VIIGLALAVQSSSVDSCRRTPPVELNRLDASRPVVRAPAAAVWWQPRTHCKVQAARVAARGLDTPAAIGWQVHYSSKYDHCYVLVDYELTVENDTPAVVSELWDAFEATMLAACTNDGRTSVQRRACFVAESEDPSTSCAVCRYFIDDHMRE
jgi:hypothetical protein